MASPTAFPDFPVQEFLRSGALLALSDDSFWVAWGERQALGARPPATTAIFAPDFYLCEPRPWLLFEHSGVLSAKALERALCAAGAGEAAAPPWNWRSPSRERWRRVFAQVHGAIAKGTLQKAVPVVFETARARVEPAVIGSMLRKLFGARRVRIYGAWNEAGGMLGGTPETLFSLPEPRRLRTMALAGTRAHSAAPWDDPKENHEHELVVDDICRVLGELGTVARGPRQILSLTSLDHLCSAITLAAREPLAPEALARALHPTAALGVAPRAADWRRLREWDDGERARFGAPFAVAFADGTAEAVVAIRGLQWDGDEVRLGAGCGVVALSEEAREWRELELKRESVKEMLGLSADPLGCDGGDAKSGVELPGDGTT